MDSSQYSSDSQTKSPHLVNDPATGQSDSAPSNNLYSDSGLELAVMVAMMASVNRAQGVGGFTIGAAIHNMHFMIYEVDVRPS